ncbi:hypothetical protein EV714DRAFT_238250 [Schizophyllum commune]
MPAEWNLPSLARQELRRVFDNDEDLDAPFMTVDPWRGRWGRRLNDATVDVETGPSASQILAHAPFGRYKPDAVPRVPQKTQVSKQKEIGIHRAASRRAIPRCGWQRSTRAAFCVVPTTLYLCALFRLPALYFSRVARVFENADLCRRDVIRMAVARATLWEQALGGSVNQAYGYTFHEPQGRELSVPLLQFKKTWEQFVDNLLHEWKVLNVISALLTSAVLTILQIDAAAADPVVRTAALLALVCTLMSLLYGCLYTVRFGSMKAMYKASEWALEAQKTTTNRFWNVWVMLAMPAVWLLWSIVSFIVAIMAFVWRTGARDELEHGDPFTTSGQALASRVIISVSLALGTAYFMLVVHRRWRENVHEQMRRERQLKTREAGWKGRAEGDGLPVGEMYEEKEAWPRADSPELPMQMC